MKDCVTAAVIGLGRIGRTHAEILVSRVGSVRVKYAADAFLNEEMKKWAKELGIKGVTDDPEICLQDPEVDAVYICTSTDTHSEYITRAAKAGKHIFSEKPLDSDLVRLSGALREAEKAGVKFQTGFMRRFDRNHSKAKALIRSGKVGRGQMIRLSCRDTVQSPYEYLKVSGGIFFDMMIHDFDMVRFLTDSEAEEIYAAGGVFTDERLNDIPDVDTAAAFVRMKNGMLAVIDNGRQCWYGHDQRSEIFCTEGTVQVMNEHEDTVVVKKGDGIYAPKPPDFFIERYYEAYVSENQSFVDSILFDRPAAVTAADGVEPIRMAKAAQLSLEQNRPVKLSEITECRIV
ncbi:inositol 2-dehydrogenase [[Clostridium] hylemonae]|uniref:inositol 2-dehydrogenase n=1 Tax=[Clostridium] hylemonae TaxID=89153 RepID=UPI001FCC077F|nr:inositol 2-dehydrogenase [[Clostridium] hylemonae]BDF04200.1 inositol 2-dehydrogenase [[Clostridium] hylemonae]